MIYNVPTSDVIYNALVPGEGPKAIPLFFDFTAQPNYDVDLTMIQQGGTFSLLQTLWIDNWDNTNPVIVMVSGSGQRIMAKGGTQGYYSVLCPNAPHLNFSLASATVAPTRIFAVNVPVPPVIWSK